MEMDAALVVLLNPDSYALLLAVLVVEIVWSELARLVMMATPLPVMVALALVKLNLDGLVLPLVVVALPTAVIEFVLALNNAMMETKTLVMDAAPLVLWRLDGSALLELLAFLTVEIESLSVLNNATTVTPPAVMVVALLAKKNLAGLARPPDLLAQLSAEMVTNVDLKDVTTETLPVVMVAVLPVL